MKFTNTEGVFLRVAGTVGEHNPVRREFQYFFRRGILRHNGDGAAAPCELLGYTAFRTVIDENHAVSLQTLSQDGIGFLAAQSPHLTPDGIGYDIGKIRWDVIADFCIHDAVLPDDAGEFPGIDPQMPGTPFSSGMHQDRNYSESLMAFHKILAQHSPGRRTFPQNLPRLCRSFR